MGFLRRTACDVVNYYVLEDDPDFETPIRMPKQYSWRKSNGWDCYECRYEHDQMAAEKAADHYWSACDGWEDARPLEIVLESGDGKRTTWKVEMESVPEFYAYKQESEASDES